MGNGTAAAAAKSLQSCPTLSDPMDCSPPGSSNHGIFQARVLEWGAIALSEEMGLDRMFPINMKSSLRACKVGTMWDLNLR